MRFLQPDVAEAARLHAMAQHPRESCGAVTPDGYVPLVNVDPDPENHFNCDAQLEPLREAGELLALIHSHPSPDHALAPSERDIANQIAMDIPWGIVLCADDAALAPYFWGEPIEPPPLLGREFRHGPSGTDGKGDCGALIKDWYRINRGIMLAEMPRQDNWWREGKNLYQDHFAERGFVRADRARPEVGDLVLIKVLSPVINHAGIYVGQGQFMHHLERRLSRVEPLVNWRNLIADWLRYAA